MMLGASALMGSSGDGAAASGGSSDVGASSSVPVEDFERSGGGGGGGGGGGNRWPRQETLTLLKIRSDMDAAFRDSSLKGPLWEEVSRKLMEFGFQRSAKKCKEKFENVFKYHKRTKDGRASKSDGKTYRFFDQLEALENAPPPLRSSHAPAAATMAAQPMPATATNLPMPPSSHITVSSTGPNPFSVVPPIQTSNNPINSPPFQPSQPPPLQQPPAANPPPPIHTFQPPQPHLPRSDSTSSSSTSSDEDIQRRRGRKRRWKDFFQVLMKDVIHKQEELQKKFLDTLEKRERDRMAREEAWRVQEMARMNREHEFLVQERSIAAAKDAAVIAFLQKVTEQNNLQIPISSNIASPRIPTQSQPPKNPQPPPPPPQQHTPTPPPLLQLPALPSPPVLPKPVAAAALALTPTPTRALEISKTDNGGDSSMPASSSRWPKAEVQALINLRTSLDLKYQENGPKGPLWEEISSAMAKLGYNRSSKRCKEKWENINKYFKKVKESSKKRPEDSKTCPYFHQLDAIYKERTKNDGGGGGSTAAVFSQGYAINPDNPMAPIMARPEQQWPLPDQPNQAMPDQDHDNESDNNEIDDDDDDDEEDEGGSFEIVTNKQQPSSAANTAE